jgi:hypothetical protein
MESKQLDRDKSLDFIFGGKSIFTCKNIETQKRFTYRVRKHKTDDIWFVSVLTSPDIYQFIGSIRKDSNYNHSRKSIITSEAQSVKVIDYIIKALRVNKLPEIVQIWHEGKCGRCGRRLTVPESLITGFGPECVKMANLSKIELRDIKLRKILN